jgi:hypothetical protein
MLISLLLTHFQKSILGKSTTAVGFQRRCHRPVVFAFETILSSFVDARV